VIALVGIAIAASREQASVEPAREGQWTRLPLRGRVRDRIGAPRSHGAHQGIDIYADSDKTVYAHTGGIVDVIVDGRKSHFASRQRAGLFVELKADDGNLHRYLHLGSLDVQEGQRIEKGQRIGVIEKDHLHFEIRRGYQRYGEPQLPILS